MDTFKLILFLFFSILFFTLLLTMEFMKQKDFQSAFTVMGCIAHNNNDNGQPIVVIFGPGLGISITFLPTVQYMPWCTVHRSVGSVRVGSGIKSYFS